MIQTKTKGSEQNGEIHERQTRFHPKRCHQLPEQTQTSSHYTCVRLCPTVSHCLVFLDRWRLEEEVWPHKTSGTAVDDRYYDIPGTAPIQRSCAEEVWITSLLGWK